MNTLEDMLKEVASGALPPKEAAERIRALSVIDLGHTKIDAFRAGRTGFGEVIYGAGKTPGQIVEIARELMESGERVLATRLTREASEAMRREFPQGRENAAARTFSIDLSPREKSGLVAIVTAGTSDMPVAEEARECAEFFGSATESFLDCGVAGLHRLLLQIEKIRRARAVVAIAGMEGALASVLAGLVKVPVIAVPTDVGYGANFGGLAALLAMMNSCANGVSVVNINNGFGAAYCAHLINSGAA